MTWFGTVEKKKKTQQHTLLQSWEPQVVDLIGESVKQARHLKKSPDIRALEPQGR